MKKVIIIGCPGGGKSTFARALHEKTGLPLFHLDMIYWNPDRTTVSRDVFDAHLDELLKKDEWIIDGNYERTMERRISACDTVFFLDIPIDVCLDGIKARKGKARTDMPWIDDGGDEHFISFVKDFEASSKPKILELLEKYSDKSVIVMHSRKEIDDYLR